jgi:hypothetical protein
MTGEMVVQLIMSAGVIPALFVWLLMYVMAENKKDKTDSRLREAALIEESRKREVALMEHISKSDSVLNEIMKSVESINTSMCIVQTDVTVLKERK